MKPAAPTVLLFVYGSLKAGFFNHHVNRGVRVPGLYETLERFPLYVIGEHYHPWLVHRPGQGQHVLGQLFRVDPDALGAMDLLERIGEPGWYLRLHVRVCERGDPRRQAIDCEAYFGCGSRLEGEAERFGPLAEYTQAHAALHLQSRA